eukprot:Lankesteria_metandrocarpae@DN165_c0_g1_i1.p1
MEFLKNRQKGHKEPMCRLLLYTLIGSVLICGYGIGRPVEAVVASSVCAICFVLTACGIPPFMTIMRTKGFCGFDLNKAKSPDGKDEPVPEALGIVAASVFIIVCIACQVVYSSDPSQLLQYNATLLSITFMTFLGFADDTLDLKWRYKMTLPFFASLPLICAYFGSTDLNVPLSLQFLLGSKIKLGYLYFVYMSGLVIFCSNSINIYAGINGIEVGQSVVIGIAIVVYNLIELKRADSPVHVDCNLFSLLLSMGFIGVSLSLAAFNWYPSDIFLGDTYTYFAGVTLAAIGITGRFSRTLVLFFVPEVLNFLISLPQLLKIIPCPRHRLPKLNPETGKLVASPNLTLINITLRVLGPMQEEVLVTVLLVFHAFCCMIGLFIRYSYLLSEFFT